MCNFAVCFNNLLFMRLKKCDLYKTSVLLGLFVLLLYLPVKAQECRVVEKNDDGLTLVFESGEISSKTVKTDGRFFSELLMEGFGSSSVKGAPRLPVMSKMVPAPVCSGVSVSVVDYEFAEYDCAALGLDFDLLPSQGSVPKSSPRPAFYINDSIYHIDSYYSLPLVSVSDRGVYRDVSLAGLTFSPVSYNPVSRRVRVCTRALVKVSFNGVDKEETTRISRHSSRMFGIDSEMLASSDEPLRDEYTSSPISYLIVAHSMFRQNQDLQEFVEWKKKLGYIVKIAYTDDPGVGTSRNSIKNYIKDCFDNATEDQPAPLFLLLVGDNEQIPAFNSTVEDEYHFTDLYYAAQVGDDYLPDCYYGRLSAQNQTDLSSQIRKILTYEQFAMDDPSYLGNAVLIAGHDSYFGPRHANGQINYVNQNYINTQNPRYQSVKVHLHDCSSQAALIRSEIGEGAGWVNYTAHGTEDSWALPQLNVNHVYALQNSGKYGVMVGNCCLSGKFDEPQCFGEALLRAPDKGAMAYIGASNNSYWDEDFYWAVGIRNVINDSPSYNANHLGCYDRLFHSHGESPSSYVSTIGGIINAGNMSVLNSSSELKKYYWEIYHCFGDPSVRAFLGVPSTMEPSYSSTVVFGMPSIEVLSQPWAYVALTDDDGFVSAAFADENGLAVLDISNVLSPGDFRIAITAQNHVPYFGDLQIISTETPFIIAKSAKVPENIDFLNSDNAVFDLQLENVGSCDAAGVYATLSSDNPNITIIGDSVYVGALASHETYSKESAFAFSISGEKKDNMTLLFYLHLHWDTMSVLRKIPVTVKIPDVVLLNLESTVQGSVVKTVNPGDMISIVFTSSNNGHGTLVHGLNDLTCNYSGAEVISPSSSFGNVAHLESFEKTFDVRISDQVPPRTLIPFYYHTIYGPVHKVDTFFVTVGVDMETFETADFSQYGWQMQNKPWLITSEVKYSGSYSARSSYNTGSFGVSKMKITLSTESASQLAYFRKTSSEAGYDIFKLYMDGDEVDRASGDIDWKYVSVDVPAGTHTFEFAYEKDGNLSVDSDCVWIDNVILPCNLAVVVEDVDDVVGVEEQKQHNSAKVYPNPAGRVITVESDKPLRSFRIHDMNGRVVSAGSLDGTNRNFVDVGSLPSGLYMLQVEHQDNSLQNFKIIKR